MYFKEPGYLLEVWTKNFYITIRVFKCESRYFWISDRRSLVIEKSRYYYKHIENFKLKSEILFLRYLIPKYY